MKNKNLVKSISNEIFLKSRLYPEEQFKAFLKAEFSYKFIIS